MFKKAFRLGIMAMLVVSVLFGAIGAQPAKAAESHSVVQQDWNVISFTFSTSWNGSYDFYSWNLDPIDALVNFGSYDPNTTFGTVQKELEANAGFHVVLLVLQCGPDELSDPIVSRPPASAPIKDYPVCSGAPFTEIVAFKAKHEPGARLTLYGYDLGGGKSCVLYSLDGSHPINVDKTCGGKAELVCTVKLIGKDLKYDCADGHESMGFNIAHDPKWLSWADKFARRYHR
jgi:hypothetical protein